MYTTNLHTCQNPAFGHKLQMSFLTARPFLKSLNPVNRAIHRPSLCLLPRLSPRLPPPPCNLRFYSRDERPIEEAEKREAYVFGILSKKLLEKGQSTQKDEPDIRALVMEDSWEDCSIAVSANHPAYKHFHSMGREEWLQRGTYGSLTPPLTGKKEEKEGTN